MEYTFKSNLMKPKLFFSIALQLIVLFSFPMAATFIPEHMREFFGDKKYPTQPADWKPQSENAKWEDPGHRDVVDREWDWGARHQWFAAGMVMLFLLSVANVVLTTIRMILKEYNLKL
jgi:hypothetical protein